MHGFRSATGVLVLSTALLVGSAGGAAAIADTGDDSTATASSGDRTSAAKSASTSASDVAESLRDAVTTALRGSDSLTSQAEESTQSLSDSDGAEEAALAQRDIESLAGEESDAAADVGVVESEASEPAAYQAPADALPVGTESEVAEDAAPASVASMPTTHDRDADTVATFPAAVTLDSDDSLTPSAAVAAPLDVSNGQGDAVGDVASDPVSEPEPLATSLFTVVTTMQTVVVSLGSAAAAIPPAIWALPFSQTPISDVIALLETVLGSVEQSVTAMAQLPGNIVALFGVPVVGTDAVALAGIAETSDHRLIPLLDAGPAAPFPTVSPLLGQMSPALAVDDFIARTGFVSLSPTALAALAAPTQIPSASIPALAGDYETLFDRAFGALLVPLSLWALATGALPGLVGLLVVFGAGARVGYRQAKAGLALKVAGIARFAGTGPLGVVRTGSFVVLHHKGMRADGPRIGRWALPGDQVA